MIDYYDEAMALQNILKNSQNLTPKEIGDSINEYMNTIDINKQAASGITPLCYAAKIGDLELVRMLLDNGADPNIVSKNDNPPLSFAAQNGSVDIATELVMRGAQINIQNQEGRTPLMYSAANGRLAVTQYLMEQGGDINIQDQTGTTALLFAVKYRHKEILEYLIDNGANMDLQNNKGVSGNKIKQAVIDLYNRSTQKTIKTDVAEAAIVTKDQKNSTKFRDLVARSKSRNPNHGLGRR